MGRPSVTLPHGYAHSGQWVQTAQIHPLTGYDERFLAEEVVGYPPAARITALLARLVSLVHEEAPRSSLDAIRKLTIGDREALILYVCRSLFDERLSCMLRCPRCAETMNLDLSLRELLVPPSPHPEAEYSMEAEGYHIVLRPLRGEDLERAAGAADAVEFLLRACLVKVDPPLSDGSIPSALIDALSDRLSALDPQADILLGIQCPACGNADRIPFDAGDFLQQAMESRQENLEKEVHALAFYYHWTEEAILALPLHRRRRYMEMIADTVSRAGS